MLEATSELIAFCDADDVWRQDKLELQVQALAENPEASAAFCGLVIVDAEFEPLDEPPTPDFASLDLASLVHHRAGDKFVIGPTALRAYFNQRVHLQIQ